MRNPPEDAAVDIKPLVVGSVTAVELGEKYTGPPSPVVPTVMRKMSVPVGQSNACAEPAVSRSVSLVSGTVGIKSNLAAKLLIGYPLFLAPVVSTKAMRLAISFMPTSSVWTGPPSVPVTMVCCGMRWWQ